MKALTFLSKIKKGALTPVLRLRDHAIAISNCPFYQTKRIKHFFFEKRKRIKLRLEDSIYAQMRRSVYKILPLHL
jgi:hypothetical protein